MLKRAAFGITLFLCVAGGIFGAFHGLPLRLAQEVICLCGALLFLSLSLVKNIWLKVFCVLSIVRCAILFNEVSLCTLLTTLVVIFMLERLVATLNKDRADTVLNIIACIALLQALYVILQYAGLWLVYTPFRATERDWIMYFKHTPFMVSVFKYSPANNFGADLMYFGGMAGTTGNINIVSALFAMSLPAFFRRRWCLLLPLIIFGLIITHSLTGIIAAAIITIVFIFNKTRQIKWYVLAGIIIAAIFYFHKFETLAGILAIGGRGDAWETYINRVIPTHWVIGHGLGQTPYLWRIVQNNLTHPSYERWLHPHNEYINIAVELGILGLAAILGYIGALLIKAKRAVRSSNTAYLSFLGVISGLLVCMTSFTCHVATGFILLLNLAILQYYTISKEGTNEA